jgi:hypothetical protein
MASTSDAFFSKERRVLAALATMLCVWTLPVSAKVVIEAGSPGVAVENGTNLLIALPIENLGDSTALDVELISIALIPTPVNFTLFPAVLTAPGLPVDLDTIAPNGVSVAQLRFTVPGPIASGGSQLQGLVSYRDSSSPVPLTQVFRLTIAILPPIPSGTKIRINKVGTVNVQNLPPPVPTNRTEADAESGEPQIFEPPGRPGPAMAPSGFSDPMRPLKSTSDPTLTEFTEFTALSESGTLAPPDTQIAAGRTRLLEMVNVTGAFYNKFNNSQIKTFDLGSLFLTNQGQGTDPRVVFDEESATYFAAYELRSPGGDEIRLGVAPEPGDNWTIYSVSSNNVDTCFDQPKLGFSLVVVTLSWNDYKNAQSCGSLPGKNFNGSEYIVVQKLGLLAALGSVPAVIWGPDTSRFGVFPSQSKFPSSTQYAAYHWDGTSNFHVMTFVGEPGVSDVNFTADDSYGIGSVSGPPAASQPSGGNMNIDAAGSGSRMLSVVWQNDSLWGVFNEGCIQSDQSNHVCQRFVNVSTSNKSVSQNVQLFASGADLYYGAVTLNGDGDLFFGLTISSTTLNLSAAVGGVPGAVFGPVTGGIIYQSGAQAYSSTNRWGDYSGAASDPDDPTLIWVAQEYGGLSNPAGNWGTAIGGFFFGTAPGLVSSR